MSIVAPRLRTGGRTAPVVSAARAKIRAEFSSRRNSWAQTATANSSGFHDYLFQHGAKRADAAL